MRNAENFAKEKRGLKVLFLNNQKTATSLGTRHEVGQQPHFANNRKLICAISANQKRAKLSSI